jgi:hypothetical protein
LATAPVCRRAGLEGKVNGQTNPTTTTQPKGNRGQKYVSYTTRYLMILTDSLARFTAISLGNLGASDDEGGIEVEETAL